MEFYAGNDYGIITAQNKVNRRYHVKVNGRENDHLVLYINVVHEVQCIIYFHTFIQIFLP